MNRKINDDLKIKTILEKVESKLKSIAKDPDVMGYNYYNDSKFVGAKVMRNKKITLEQVAQDLAVLTKLVIEGFTEQKKFNAEQRIINEEQKKFNEEQKKFNEEQKKYNKKIDKIESDMAEIKKDLKEVRELPIIKEALKKSKTK